MTTDQPHDCGDPNCPGHSPEQLAFLGYWKKVLKRVLDPDKFVLTVSSNREVDDYVRQKFEQYKKRQEMGWPNLGLCDSCQFIAGMCPNSDMNKLAGKKKPLPKVLACPEYLSGEKLERPPNISIEDRVTLVIAVEVRKIKGKEFVFVIVAKWNKKTNQYELSYRGMEKARLEAMEE